VTGDPKVQVRESVTKPDWPASGYAGNAATVDAVLTTPFDAVITPVAIIVDDAVSVVNAPVDGVVAPTDPLSAPANFMPVTVPVKVPLPVAESKS
jgi:hypothetical protein